VFRTIPDDNLSLFFITTVERTEPFVEYVPGYLDSLCYSANCCLLKTVHA